MLPFNAGRQFMDGWNEFSQALDEFGDWEEEEQMLEPDGGVRQDNSIIDADLIYGTSGSNDSVRPMAGVLEDRGYDVEIIEKRDIDRRDGEVYVKGVPGHELEDKDMIWRSYGFVRSDSDYMAENIELLKENGVKTLPTPQGVRNCDDKRYTKQKLEDASVNTTEQYCSPEEIEEAKSEGKIIVEKPANQSGGDGIRFIQPEDSFHFDPDNIYEEFVDHYNDPYTVERRAVTFTGDNVSQLVEVKNRELKNQRGELKPKNISGNNGQYADLDPENAPLLEEEINDILETSEAMNGGILGLDYTVDLRTGETKIIEVNSNVGVKGIREASNVDFYDALADAVEGEIEGEYSGRAYAGHLDDVIGDELSYDEYIENMLEPAQIHSSDYSAAQNKASTV